MEWFSRLFRDFRYAFRSLLRSPAMATAAIMPLALGIGANTAIFSVLEGVVLRPLPFPLPDRLVIVSLFNRRPRFPRLAARRELLRANRCLRLYFLVLSRSLIAPAGSWFQGVESVIEELERSKGNANVIDVQSEGR
jgi:hypothetical protein